MSAAEAVVVDPTPFDFPGDGRAGALCLHGLTGTPYEVRPLGAALAAAGIRALGPVLPGHDDTPQRLARVSHQEWVEAARRELHRLRQEHDRVFCLGLSMGGLVTLQLASEEPIDAVVVVGTPLRLAQPIAALISLARFVVPYVKKKVGSDIRDPEARRRHPSFDVMPLAAVHQLQHLQRRVRSGLPRVRAPLLAAHGALDRTANPADSKEIFDGVGSKRREHLVLERSGHVVPVDYDGPALADAIVRFLRG